MGHWGYEPFDNDTAADWQSVLINRGDFAFLESTLMELLSTVEEPDGPEPYRVDQAIAAADVVRWLGRRAAGDSMQHLLDESYVGALYPWIMRHPAPSTRLLMLALTASEWALENSDPEDWVEGGWAERSRVLHDLVSDLRTAPASEPEFLPALPPAVLVTHAPGLDQATVLADQAAQEHGGRLAGEAEGAESGVRWYEFDSEQAAADFYLDLYQRRARDTFRFLDLMSVSKEAFDALYERIQDLPVPLDPKDRFRVWLRMNDHPRPSSDPELQNLTLVANLHLVEPNPVFKPLDLDGLLELREEISDDDFATWKSLPNQPQVELDIEAVYFPFASEEEAKRFSDEIWPICQRMGGVVLSIEPRPIEGWLDRLYL